MDKWDYITILLQLSDPYGNLVVDLMERFNKINLQLITKDEAKQFYEEVVLHIKK